MKRFVFLFGLFLWCFVSFYAQPAAAWHDGQDAMLVLGQENFTDDTPNISQTGMSYPVSIAVDPTTNKVFVSDYSSSRVLRFASLQTLLDGNPAEAVFGQEDWVSGNDNAGRETPLANTLDHPMHLAVDTAGRLWVADLENNRVLRFDNASAKTGNSDADGVLGQPDFVSSADNQGMGGTPGQNTMYGPTGVAVDTAGTLWVADYYNNRILRFDNAAAKANGANADGVLGQPDFVSSGENQGGDLAANTLSAPRGLWVDAQGRLWAADANNDRVLRYDNAAAKAIGGNADGVLGQLSFTTREILPFNARVNYPRGVAVDAGGTLSVADFINHRIMIFRNAASKANGGAADNVLGQEDFTGTIANRGGAPAANTLHHPDTPWVHDASLSLLVPDSDNNRVLRYKQPLAAVTIATVSDVTATAFRSGGIVSSDGGNTVTARGVCYNTAGNPTVKDTCTDEGGGGGSFISDVSGLQPGTKYYVRAYATTLAGTAYSAGQETLTTLHNVPVFPGHGAWILGAFALLLLLSGFMRGRRRS